MIITAVFALLLAFAGAAFAAADAETGGCPAPDLKSKADKVQTLKNRFSRILTSERLDAEQRDYLVRLNAALTVDTSPEDLEPYEAEAIALFSPIVRIAYFAAVERNLPAFASEPRKRSSAEVVFTRATYTPKVTKRQGCSCSIGSSFNQECAKTNWCARRFLCLQTEDGCGFVGWYPCDGHCYTVV
jgi:hypothetical protein